MNYQKINEETINRWIKEEDWEWGKPIDHETFINAKEGKWDVFLSPTIPVPHEWLGDIKGKRILGLASGGAQQMPILTSCGAKCSVIDISQVQIDSELMVARREGYTIDAIKGDITKPLPYQDNAFDIIFSPISYCYIEKLEPIFKECNRVLKPNGLYMFGIDNNLNYITNDEERIENSMPFNPLINKEQLASLQEDDCGIQFSHSFTEIFKGLIKNNFELLDIYEDYNGRGRLNDLHIPTYLCLLVRKTK